MEVKSVRTNYRIGGGRSSSMFDLKKYEKIPMFFKALPGPGLSFRFKVQSDSMGPFIMRGDIVTVEPVISGPMRIGQVVIFQNGAVLLVHKLLFRYMRGSTVWLLNDGSSIPEPETDELLGGRVLGRVRSVERDGKSIDFDSNVVRLASIGMAMITPFAESYRNLKRRLGEILKSSD